MGVTYNALDLNERLTRIEESLDELQASLDPDYNEIIKGKVTGSDIASGTITGNNLAGLASRASNLNFNPNGLSFSIVIEKTGQRLFYDVTRVGGLITAISQRNDGFMTTVTREAL